MKEENFTQIPNEVLEVLARTKFRNYELRYIFVLLRKTFGWGKPSDYIANSQFVRATGIRKSHISRTQNALIERKIVTLRGNKLSLNANYGEWKVLPKKVTVTPGGQNVTSVGEHKIKNQKKYIASKRGEVSFERKDYDMVLEAYQRLKGIMLQGQEVLPVRQALKSMFMSERTPQQIIACMEWLASLKDDWAKNWVIGTVQKKMPEFVAGKFTKDNSWQYAR